MFIFDTNINKEKLINNLLNETTKNNTILVSIKDKLTMPNKLTIPGYDENIIIDDFDYNKSKSEYVIDTYTNQVEEPIVYLYNTHQLEEYSTETIYDYSVKPNVLIGSYILREKLNNKGINTIVETNNIKEYLNNNNLSYNMSYHASEYFARLKLEEYPSIKYLIDIHRDSVSYEKTFVTIDNVAYAKVLLLSGYEHTLKENNTNFANELNDLIDKMYPGLSRGVIINNNEPVNGVYNANLNGKSVLIEVGGVDNKLEEVNNTMEALSNVLTMYIGG